MWTKSTTRNCGGHRPRRAGKMLKLSILLANWQSQQNIYRKSRDFRLQVHHKTAVIRKHGRAG
jgi:hypothetical protein